MGEIVPVPCSQTGPTASRHSHVSFMSPSIPSQALSQLISLSLYQHSQNIQQFLNPFQEYPGSPLLASKTRAQQCFS